MAPDFFVEALRLTLFISLPPLLVSVVVGLIVGVLQAATQIQEQSISYALKLIGVVITLMITAPWYCREFSEFVTKSLSFTM